MPIIMNSIPQGYALQEAWSNLQSKCSLINSLIESTVNAVYDGDSYTVLENKDTIGNLDVLEIAIYVENTLSKEIANLKNLIKNESIEIKFSYDECKEIARRYAEYYFENIEIGVITGETTPVVFKDINGKHYVFSVEGIENVNILISVEDKSIIRQEHLDTGFRYAYEDINVLPATDEETAMPNLIGMELSQATAVLDSMGISYEIGWIDFEDVEYGCVAHQYPSAGKVVFDDTVVNLLLAK